MIPDEIMDRAADIIDILGWSTGKYRNVHGQVCLMGALRLADNPKDDGLKYGKMYSTELKNAIFFIQIKLGDSIPEWNDYVCTGREQAVEFLRSEAKRYREQMQA